jgi:CheY-like chemotaxis protein
LRAEQKTCFIIDDDAIAHYITKHLFNLYFDSWTTEVYFNGLEALLAIDNSKNRPPELILLDINMPVMNGWEFLNKLQDYPQMKKIPIAIVSSSIDPRDIEKAKQYPQVIQFLLKPLNKEAIEKLFQKWEWR